MARDDRDVGVLGSLVGYHLRRASGAFAVDFAGAMDGTGMRQVLFAILSIVESRPGINQGAVGQMLNIKRPNMVALINELIERRYLERIVAPEDKRAFALTLTSTGRAIIKKTAKRIQEHEARMLGRLTECERQKLIDLLARIYLPHD